MKLIKWSLLLIPLSIMAMTSNQNITTRVEQYSASFLGKPYKLGALGEGPNGKIDKNPLYRTDSFDCVTYVSTVLALVESNTPQQLQTNIRKIRYKNGQVSYFNRNHFISVDWNKNNAQNGFVQDITASIVNKNGEQVAAVADATIDKPGWYRMKKLPKLAQKARPEPSTILYIPLSKLFINGKPNMYLFNQVPSGSVIEIIRPNWNLKAKIGTNLNVSHMGFAIRTKKGLMFRNASSLQGKVVDVPLIDYLQPRRGGFKTRPYTTVKGINIQKIIEP